MAHERAGQEWGRTQRAALLEQVEEEKKTGQQARLASIREQPASLVRWLSATLAGARKELAEAWLAATETLTPAEARREPTKRGWRPQRP